MNTLDIAAHAQSVATQGYTVIPNQIGAESLRKLNAAADRALDAVSSAISDGVRPAYTQQNAFYRSARCFYCWDPSTQQLLEHETVLALADAVLGQPRLWDMTVLEALPMPKGAELGPFNWHRDFSASDKRKSDAYLWIFICLTDVTGENGATWAIPGSHRDALMEEPKQATASDPPPANAVQLTARAGDIVVINPVMYHCVGENRTLAGRRLALVGMCRSDQPPLLNHWAIAGTKLQRKLPAKVRALMRTNDMTLAGTWDVLPPGWVVSKPSVVKRAMHAFYRRGGGFAKRCAHALIRRSGRAQA